MISFHINEKESGQTLEKYVRKVLNTAPLSFIYKLFRRKDIKVNGHWEKEKYILNENDEVSIYITDAQLEEFNKKNDYQPNDKIKDWIIYEDKNLLLINKPRGVLVQKDDHSTDKALDQLVIEYLMFKNEYNPQKDQGFKPGPAHRIDRNTSGIVMFGKNHETLVYLFELLKDHELIGKHYISLVVGEIEEDGVVEAPLRKNFDLKKVVVASKKDGGKESKTIYHVLERLPGYTLLDLTLVTGRTHQIRAHMSYIRHHVVGDTKYGDFKANNYFKKEFNFENQFLHASELHFGHLKKPLDYLSSKSFKAEMPLEYNEIIQRLRGTQNG
ncbi:MAG: RluA family pseudouridine synthase [Bacilli bacterium]|nr:RluA family pseudouridine synthase [Bacilli bacterium]